MPGKPAHGDGIILGARQWARPTGPQPPIEPAPLYARRERMLDLHDGHARSAPAAA